MDPDNLNFSNIDGLLYNKAKTTLIACPEALTGTINIPEGVTSISSYAFCQCVGLTSINLPSSLTSIGLDSFGNCTGLTSINIPQGVTSIDWSAFSDCTRLTAFSIPDSLTSISNGDFQGCTSLTNVNIPQNIQSIGFHAFSGCTGLKTITINSATTSIDDSYDTIPVTTKIIGDDPSNAKDYAAKYDNSFEAIGAASVPTTTKSTQVSVTSIAGSNSYGTSLEIANQFVKEEGKLNNLVIVTGSNWPDALSGSPLAGTVNSPLLMVPTNIAEATDQLDFIINNVNGGGTIYILGGTSVVSSDYDNTLTLKGFVVKRLAGNDAADTSVIVASELAKLKSITGVCIVSNENYVDAVSISSYASKEGLPILVTNRDSAKDSLVSFIEDNNSAIKNVCIIGGTAVVGDGLVKAISPVLKDGSSSIQRLWGNDMYDTNNVVHYTLPQDATKLAISSSDDYISSLSGAVYAGHNNTFLMIVPPSNLAQGNINTLKSIAPKITNITIFGTINTKSELLSYFQN